MSGGAETEVFWKGYLDKGQRGKNRIVIAIDFPEFALFQGAEILRSLVSLTSLRAVAFQCPLFATGAQQLSLSLLTSSARMQVTLAIE